MMCISKDCYIFLIGREKAGAVNLNKVFYFHCLLKLKQQEIYVALLL